MWPRKRVALQNKNTKISNIEEEGELIHSDAYQFSPPAGFVRQPDEEEEAANVWRSEAGDYLAVSVLSTDSLEVPTDPPGSVRDSLRYTWTGEQDTQVGKSLGRLLYYTYNAGASQGQVAIFWDEANTLFVDLKPAARMEEVLSAMTVWLVHRPIENALVERPPIPVRADVAIGPPLGLVWGMDLWTADAYMEGMSWVNSFPDEWGQPGDYERGPYMEIYRGGSLYGVPGVVRLYFGDEEYLVAVDFQSYSDSSCTNQFESMVSGARQDWGAPSDSARDQGQVGENLCASLASGAEDVLYRDWWAGPGDWWANQSQAPTGEFVGNNGLVIGIGEKGGEAISYGLWEHDAILPDWEPVAALGERTLALGLDWGMALEDVHAAVSAEGLENIFPDIMGMAASDEDGYSGFPYLVVYEGVESGGWPVTARFYFAEDRGLARMVFSLEEPGEGCGGVFAALLNSFTAYLGPPLVRPPYSASWGCGATEWGDGAVAVWEDGVGRLIISASREVAVTYEPF